MDKDWRCQRYGPLGWLETLVKAFAIGVGIASLSIYKNVPRVLRAKRITQIVFMGIIGGVFLAAIVQRVLDKELFALGFMIVQFFGHWIMTIILILSDDPGSFIFVYVILMICGEFIKLCFLGLAENIDVKYLNRPILFGISIFFVVLYIIIMILQVVQWLVDYTAN